MADPTMPYDHSMRLLVEREPATLLSYLLKRPISNDEIRRVPAELSGPSVRLDTVFELGDPPRVLHMEFEINARPDRLHPRLLTYFERLHTAYGDAPTQYVIVLERSKGRLPGTYQSGGMKLDYNVIHLWDADPGPLLADPNLSPLAVLASLARNESPLVRVTNVLDRIEAIADSELRRQLIADTETYGRLVLDRPTMKQLLRRYPIMPIYVEEHPLYQDGLEQGRIEGREEGRQTGREEGRQEAVRMLTRILQQQLPDLGAVDIERVNSLDRQRLELLSELAFGVPSVDALRAWFDQNL